MNSNESFSSFWIDSKYSKECVSLYFLSWKALRVCSKSFQTTSGHHWHSPYRCASVSASGQGCPSFWRGRLPCVLLLPGECQPWFAFLHQSSGQHRGASAARWPPSTYWSLGRKLLFWWTRCEDPGCPTDWGPGLWKFEGERIHPDQIRSLHTASGHEGGGGWCYWGVFCKGKKELNEGKKIKMHKSKGKK